MTRLELNAEYAALSLPISKDMIRNHFEHWCNFPPTLARLTESWINKLDALGYDVERIRTLKLKYAQSGKV